MHFGTHLPWPTLKKPSLSLQLANGLFAVLGSSITARGAHSQPSPRSASQLDVGRSFAFLPASSPGRQRPRSPQHAVSKRTGGSSAASPRNVHTPVALPSIGSKHGAHSSLAAH